MKYGFGRKRTSSTMSAWVGMPKRNPNETTVTPRRAPPPGDEAARDEPLQLVHVERRRVDHLVGDRLQIGERAALGGDAVRDRPAVARERVAAARLGVAAHERVVRGVEEEDLDVVPLLPDLLDDARRVREEAALARVDDERDARDLARGVAGELEQLLEEEDGEVVDAVEPGVLERAQGGRLPRAGHAGEDDDLRTARRSRRCGVTRRPSRRRARPARARWRG